MRWPLYPVLSRLRRQIRHFNSPLNSARYPTSAPSPQNALDIFKGEWWSQFPPPFETLRAGKTDMFDDPRIAWAISQFGNVQGNSILELGPLEGGHSYMLEQAGVRSVTAIEAHPRAYLRCLIAKEILGMEHTRFLHGDFVEYLRAGPPRVDAVIASGVLYHMENPVELLALLARITDKLFLWTHYYDRDLIAPNQAVKERFDGVIQREHSGFEHRLFRYVYGGSFGIGGPRPYSHWMLREDIPEALGQFGFNMIRISFETPDHPNGPAFALVALRE